MSAAAVPTHHGIDLGKNTNYSLVNNKHLHGFIYNICSIELIHFLPLPDGHAVAPGPLWFLKVTEAECYISGRRIYFCLLAKCS